MDQNELASIDWFFFWDTVDRSLLTEQDVTALLLQTPGTMYYNRRYGAGLANYENAPNALVTAVRLPADVVYGLALRNARVTDGSNGLPDRRAATGQQAIDVQQDGQEMNVTVLYVELADLSKPKSINVPLGGRSG